MGHHWDMSTTPTKDQFTADGLRYQAKVAGTPFMESAGHARMSCFLCGKHEQRSLGTWKMILGQKRFCCGDHGAAKASSKPGLGAG